ncbi:GRB2-associated-binding protein 3 isoform X1 [Rhincodon typus]|uniref:GRB2-associated-binding protein 3 isoform X1 n=2 Tax=Rhincodon typus TaxID=259920 RepID=UPI00202E0D22|nr:GRB2-associated-binding protein 3 isoform X1 [Rhincodon typus]
MSAEDIVYTGWLIKSPPEKKLKRYAWRKRWFVLRSGRMSGNPDVLEYYKNHHSKKPLRMINLTQCENVEAGLKLSKKEFQNSYIFEVKTPTRTFYLVAKTQDEMNSWVRHISLICGFSSSDDGTDSLGSSSPTTSSSLQPSPAVSTHTSQSINRDQFPTAQDSVMEADSRRSESESTMSAVVPLDYLILSQCETKSIDIARSNSCSPCDRSLDHSFELTGSDDIQENLQSKNGTPTQTSCNVPLYKNLQDSQVVIFPNQDQSGPSSASSSPMSVYSFSQIFNFDKNHNALPFGVTGIHLLSNTPPPRPPKPSQLTEREKTHKVIQNGNGAYAINPAPVPKRIPLSSLEKRSWKDTEGCNLLPFTDFQGNCIMSANEGLNLNMKLPGQQCNTTDSTDDSYVPMNPGSSPLMPTADCTSDGYIPMSPACTNLVLPSVVTDNLPLPTLSTDIEPPPVNRNLKPRVRKIKPPPLDLTSLSTIRRHYNHSCVNRTCSMPFRWSTANCITPESQCTSARSFYNTLDGEYEENYTAMERSSSVYNGYGSSHCPRTLNLDYLALDFNATSPSPVQKKPFLSSMLEERVDYVQVDEQKTQALQNTKQEWTDVRQSCPLSKTLK